MSLLFTGISASKEKLLKITIRNGGTWPVVDPSSLSQWNTLFDFQAAIYGNPFTSVRVVNNTVYLYGGFNIQMKDSLFDPVGIDLESVIDESGCVVRLGDDVFGNYQESLGCPFLTTVSFPNVSVVGIFCFKHATSLQNVYMPLPVSLPNNTFDDCTSLETISFPNLETIASGCFQTCSNLHTINLPLITTIGNFAFIACTSLSTIYIPQCEMVGEDMLNNGVFDGIAGRNITLTIKAAATTDVDITDLQNNNTVTLVTT